MGGDYEVLSPWAEVDPIPLEGLTPRPADLKGKRIGLVNNDKLASKPILSVVEAELGARLEGASFEHFDRKVAGEIADLPDRDRYEEWTKRVDAVVLAVGD